MDKEQARNLIIDTFESSFSEDNFVKFISNLLKDYNREKELSPRYGLQGNTEAYLNFIKGWQRIGVYENNGRRIDILIVELKKNVSLYRSRSTQRNFIAGYLQGKWGTKNEKDAALVAFISPESEDWRFSLVKMDYRFVETSSGKIKVEEEFTPAKRWSFLVGKNEKSHTAQSRFIPILENDNRRPSLQDLENAFNVEVVTKEFFEKYRDLFIRTKLELDKIVQNNPKVAQEFKNKNINTVDFTKKLLGQIVFLYFLQKKGWFGVEKGNPWGTGPKDFMRKLFDKKYVGYTNFFNDILEPLFYEALRLRTDRSFDDHYYSRFNCKIPFLNGGLFDPINDYNWVDVDVPLPDELFSNKNSTKEGDVGDGIFDVFNRYNFTVNEEEPLEKEVALDPELLGKIYEKLNAIREDNFDEYVKILKSGKKGEETKFNKEYGVYYTPREIVHYMCQESLINYLETQLNGKVSRSDIEKLVRFADTVKEIEETAREKEEKIKEGLQKTTIYESRLPESIKQNAEEIDNLLADIKVCDPAVGSGAFPIGMMHEIVKLRQLLSVYILKKVEDSYNLKRHCIENSLYGVDIAPGAVEICKLRFWLSLIVDEEDFYNIKPLPNLDYKVVCGDSLLGYPYEPSGLENIEELRRQYFNETDPLKKKELNAQIDKFTSALFRAAEGSLGYKVTMDFKINFSEVFRQKGGFDVVIANPPYIVYGLSPSLKLLYINNFNSIKFKYHGIKNQFNLAALFIEKGYYILEENGIFSMIIPHSISRVSGYQYIRDFIEENSDVFHIVDEHGQFEDVTLEMISIFYEKCKKRSPTIRCFSKRDNKLYFLPREIVDKEKYYITYYDSLYDKIRAKGQNILSGHRGEEIPSSPKRDRQNLCIYLGGKNIQKYHIVTTPNRRYAKRECYKTPLEKYEIVITQFGSLPKGTIIDTDIYLPSGGNVIVEFPRNIFNIKYILGILNSKLIEYYFGRYVINCAKLTIHLDGHYLNKIPVVISNSHNRNVIEQIESLVDHILSLTQSDDYLSKPNKQAEVEKLEKEIDQLVYKLYNLTDDEIKIIEGGLK